MKDLRAYRVCGNWTPLLLSWNKNGLLDAARIEGTLDILLNMRVDGIYVDAHNDGYTTLTENEYDHVTEMLASRCAAVNIPFQIGMGHGLEHVALDRLKRGAALSPAAFQIPLPDWCAFNLSRAADFIRRVSDHAAGTSLVLGSWAQSLSVVEVEQIASDSDSVIGVRLPETEGVWSEGTRHIFGSRGVFTQGYRLATRFSQGALGAYSCISCLNPGVVQEWWNQMTEDLSGALEVEQRVRHFMEGHAIPLFRRDANPCDPAGHRLLALIGGWCDLSPQMRWPCQPISLDETNQLRRAARTLIPEFFPA